MILIVFGNVNQSKKQSHPRPSAGKSMWPLGKSFPTPGIAEEGVNDGQIRLFFQFAVFVVQAIGAFDPNGFLGSASRNTRVTFHFLLMFCGVVSALLGMFSVLAVTKKCDLSTIILLNVLL